MFVPDPPATVVTGRIPIAFHALYPVVTAVPSQVIPFVLVAQTFRPCPVAMNMLPFHVIERPDPEKTVRRVWPVHVVPLGLVAIEFVPWPTATQRARAGLYAIPKIFIVIAA